MGNRKKVHKSGKFKILFHLFHFKLAMNNYAVDPVEAAAVPAAPAAAHDDDDSDELELDLMPVNACSGARASTNSSLEAPEPGFITGQVEDDDDDDEADADDAEKPLDGAKAKAGSSNCQAGPPPAKRKRLDPLKEIKVWLKKSVFKPPAESLREKSARAVAERWTASAETEAQLKGQGGGSSSAEMAYVFKVEVGAQLKGQQLIVFLEWAGGLKELALHSWPEVFERILAAVYREMSLVGQSELVRRDLSHQVRVFREHTWKQKRLQTPLHRLGLTAAFKQRWLELENDDMLVEFFEIQDRRTIYFLCPPLLVFPLPPLLQVQPKSLVFNALDYYSVGERIKKAHKDWLRVVIPAERWAEERGQALSAASETFRKKAYHDDCPWLSKDAYSPEGLHLRILSIVAKNAYHGSPSVALAVAFMALLQPHYGAEATPTARIVRVDLFWYMGRALAWLHAGLDLPWACYEMAKTTVFRQGASGPPCLGEQARLVLLQLEIFVRYGFYDRARELFAAWFGRFPSIGWLHEELVLLHISGVFHSVQDSLIEFYITYLIHTQCSSSAPCFELHMSPILRSASNRLLALRSILHRCLADPTVRDLFRNHCQLALDLCSYYQLSVKKAGGANRGMFYDDHRLELNRIWVQIRWNRDMFTDEKFFSEHLVAFTRSYPICLKSDFAWNTLTEELTTNIKKDLERESLSSSPRLHADYLYSLLVSALLHRKTDSGLQLVRLTEEAYRKSTANLHHRLALLSQLRDYLVGIRRPLQSVCPEFPILTRGVLNESLTKQSNIFHPSADREDVTVEHRTAERAHEFALSTMRDCLEDFNYQDFSSSEKFCRYLRNRDGCCPLWLENGLLCLRFPQ